MVRVKRVIELVELLSFAIPLQNGIQKGWWTYFWIPTYVGMVRRLYFT